MPTVALLHPQAKDRWREVADKLDASGLTVLHSDVPAEVERLSDAGADAILILARGLGRDETVNLTARFGRRRAGPVVVWCDLEGDDLLELVTFGATDFIAGRPGPGEVRARLLAAIEHDLTIRELRRGYAAFHKLFQDAVSPMAMAGVDGRLVDANAAFLELLGYTLEEIRRLDVETITYDEDANSLQLLAQLARGERSSYRVTKRFVRKDGQLVWANLHASRFSDPLTGEIRFITDLHDLTGEVESHRALAHAHGRFEALFEELPFALLVIDLERMRFSEANHAAEKLLGYARRDLLTLGLVELWAGDGASPEAIRALLRAEGTVGPTRQRLRRADGSILETELMITAFDYGGGTTRTVVIRDLSAQMEVEHELEPRAPGAQAPRPLPAGDRLTILLVDDDETVLSLVAEMLERSGHRVLAASEGRRALDLAEREPGDVDLLIVDATLADPSASHLAARLASNRPGLPVLVISGHLDDILTTRGSLGSATPFLSKPFTGGELLQAVASAVAGRQT